MTPTMDVEKKYVWLKKSDYIEELKLFHKVMYYLGCLKFKPWKKYKGKPYQIHAGGFYRAKMGFRLWNPLGLILCIVLSLLLFSLHLIEAFQNTFKEIIELNNQEVSINKNLEIEKNDK